jgi:hypothetical protein
MAELDTIIARDQYYGNILDQIAELKEDVNRIQISSVGYSDLERKIVRGVATQTIELGAGGALIAGADNDVTLDEDGLTMDVGSTYAEGKALTWKDGSDIVAEIYGQRSTGVWHSIMIRTKSVEPYGYADLIGEGTAGGTASILAGNGTTYKGIQIEYDPLGSGIQDTWTLGRFNAESLAVVGNSSGDPGASSISLSNGEAWFDSDVFMGGGLAVGVTDSTTSLSAGDLYITGDLEVDGEVDIADPVLARAMSIIYLQGRRGARFIGDSLNANYVNALSAYSLSLNNITAGNSKIDTTGLFPYVTLAQASTQYLYHDATTTPGWGLWGLDSGVYSWSSDPGITVGAWVKFSSFTSTPQGIITGWNATSGSATASWRLFSNNSATPSNAIVFSISNTGSYVGGQEAVVSTAPPTGRWIFCAGRFDPSTEIKTWIFDGNTTYSATKTSGIVSDAYDSRWLFWGSQRSSSGANQSLNGDLGLSFFAVSRQPDAELQKFYDISRHIYGV